MKIKQPIYLGFTLLGATCLIAGPSLVRKEFGLAIGFVLLMFGLYGISRSQDTGKAEDTDKSNGNEST
ncbi:hypothetical protein ACT6NV_11285 [Robiginitalea sp. IMCC44478]|uniref:hypothetical protein n=1 Tax=Robiginitalea sp. IMCC44478 TaxID=3459122 RepID=UPI004041E61A